MKKNKPTNIKITPNILKALKYHIWAERFMAELQVKRRSLSKISEQANMVLLLPNKNYYTAPRLKYAFQKSRAGSERYI